MERLRSRDGRFIGRPARPVVVTKPPEPLVEAKPAWNMVSARGFGGPLERFGRDDRWNTISDAWKDGRGGANIGTACFAGHRSFGKGSSLAIAITDQTLGYRYPKWVAARFDKSPRELVNWWLFEEAPKLGQETKRVEEAGNTWAEFIAAGDSYTITLGQMTFLDFPNRYPSFLLAYLKLKERLPEENPWFVFQVCHFLPAAYWRGGFNMGPETHNQVGSVFGMPYDGTGHSLGSLNGEFDLQPTYQEALACCKDRGNLNRGFFPSGNPEKCPNPEWTWDQFAQYTKSYIQAQKKGM